MPQRVYIDTSVISALHDDRTPERQRETLALWSRLHEFEASTSDLTLREIADTPDASPQALMLESARHLVVVTTSTDMLALADRYTQAGIFAVTQRADAVHVAAAVVSRHDVLVSWNFKHLVNRRRRGLISALNASLGLPIIDIIPPPEL